MRAFSGPALPPYPSEDPGERLSRLVQNFQPFAEEVNEIATSDTRSAIGEGGISKVYQLDTSPDGRQYVAKIPFWGDAEYRTGRVLSYATDLTDYPLPSLERLEAVRLYGIPAAVCEEVDGVRTEVLDTDTIAAIEFGSISDAVNGLRTATERGVELDIIGSGNTLYDHASGRITFLDYWNHPLRTSQLGNVNRFSSTLYNIGRDNSANDAGELEVLRGRLLEWLHQAVAEAHPYDAALQERTRRQCITVRNNRKLGMLRPWN